MSENVGLVAGYAFRSGDFCSEGIPIIRIGNANKGYFDLSDLVFLPESFASSHQRFVVYEDLYKRLLRDFLRKYNLRYRLDDPFTLRFLLPGSFTNLYAELHRLNAANPHFASLLTYFEHAFDIYVRSQNASDLRRCIATASNYAEGLASATHRQPGTLGAVCNQLTDWPHERLKEALQKLYGFCSDYPNIRHAGNPGSVLRPLGPRDATGLSVLLLAFSGYLSPHLDEQIVLGVCPPLSVHQHSSAIQFFALFCG